MKALIAYFYIQAGKLHLAGTLFYLFLLRLFFVVMAQICLHFGYDLLDILEELTEGTYYFLFFSKKLMVWEVKLIAEPKIGRYLAVSYSWVEEFLAASLLLAVIIPGLIDFYERLHFPFVSKTALSGWYDVDTLEGDLEKKLLKDTRSLRKIEHILKYREESIKHFFMKMFLFDSLYKRAKVIYKKRAYFWFVKRSNVLYRRNRFLIKPPKRRPNFFLFNYRALRDYLRLKYNFWRATARRW